MAYTRMEQETSIVWDEEEKVARIYTASPVSMRKLDRLCEDYSAVSNVRLVTGRSMPVEDILRHEQPQEVHAVGV